MNKFFNCSWNHGICFFPYNREKLVETQEFTEDCLLSEFRVGSEPDLLPWSDTQSLGQF